MRRAFADQRHGRVSKLHPTLHKGPGKPVANNRGLPSMHYGLLRGIVAYNSGQRGSPGSTSWASMRLTRGSRTKQGRRISSYTPKGPRLKGG